MTVMTSGELFQDAAGARAAASEGPVYVMTDGRPAMVLLSTEDYERLAGRKVSIGDLLHRPGVADVDLEAVLPERRIEPIEVDLG